MSALQVFKTDLDGGAAALFALGKYLDTVMRDGGRPRFARRVVKLDTRMPGFEYDIRF